MRGWKGTLLVSGFQIFVVGRPGRAVVAEIEQPIAGPCQMMIAEVEPPLHSFALRFCDGGWIGKMVFVHEAAA